ncbi:MAG: hypothetical protein ACREAA_16310 [Candidatus Polarisedimenticolia bacterium]
MTRPFLTPVVVSALLTGHAWAQGLTDHIQLLEPGLSIEVFQNEMSSFGYEEDGFSYLDPRVQPGKAGHGTDASGNFYQLNLRNLPTPNGWRCQQATNSVLQQELEVERRTSSSSTIIARIARCVELGEPRFQVTGVTNLAVDSVNGMMYLAVLSLFHRCDGPECSIYEPQMGTVRISGLPTLLDIILSYQPPSTLSFNVPVRPEGLPGADSFAVYAGDLRTVSDLSQASPLQCTVPAGRAPVPGEQLTVSDTLPDPATGSGRYYLAAVRHGAQIRAGRSSMGGVMQGRNAAVMPGCQP